MYELQKLCFFLFSLKCSFFLEFKHLYIIIFILFFFIYLLFLVIAINSCESNNIKLSFSLTKYFLFISLLSPFNLSKFSLFDFL